MVLSLLRTVLGLLRHFTSFGERPSTRLPRTAALRLKAARLGIRPKGRSFIPHQISQRARLCVRDTFAADPELFCSHICSGYFSLQMSPPQTAGCGNLGLWRASTLQPGCQPDSALIEDTGDPRYYSRGALISHTLHQFYKAESYHLTPQ